MRKKIFCMVLSALLFIAGCQSPQDSGTLTLEKVTQLAQSGDRLSWDDFAGYEGLETGSGLYIMVYPIDDRYHLMVGGFGPDQDPLYIKLVDMAREEDIDIRQEDVAEFLSRPQ